MLIVDGDDRQMELMSHVTSQRLEIGADQVDLPLFCKTGEFAHTARSARRRNQVLRDGALIAHTIVHICKAQPIDFRDLGELG